MTCESRLFYEIIIQKVVDRMKECEHCGKRFLPSTSIQKYCCIKCSKAARSRSKKLDPIACAICGEIFQPKQPNQKYCCFECGQEAKNIQDRLRRGKKEKKVNKICMVCGKEFTPWNNRQLTCGSDECIKARRKMQIENGVYNYGYKQKKPPKKKKYSKKEWNKLTPAERWGLMSLSEVSAENLKHHIPTYGKSEILARWGRLPSDYGKR